MTKEHRKWVLAALVLTCCAAMALIDGVLRPSYPVKSAVKLCLFVICPLLYGRVCRDWNWRDLFRPSRRNLGRAALLGAGVFAVILGAYLILRNIFDFSGITALLEENAGVTGEIFLWVALYISFVNSLLEEFFFRGFAFLALRELGGRRLAYWFSALAFALYHTAMMLGWFSLPLFLLAMAGLTIGGLIFNWLNESSGTIYISWTVHLCANFAINGIGFLLFGLL